MISLLFVNMIYCLIYSDLTMETFYTKKVSC